MKWILPVILLLLSIVCCSCSGMRPDSGITGLTTICSGQTQAVLDCKSMYEQFARTFRADVGIFRKTAAGIGVGAKKLMSLDSLTGDLLKHSRELCIQFNNCLISKNDYLREMKSIRQAQLKIREANRSVSDFYSDYDDESDQDKTEHKAAFENLFSEVVGSLINIDVDSANISTTVKPTADSD